MSSWFLIRKPFSEEEGRVHLFTGSDTISACGLANMETGRVVAEYINIGRNDEKVCRDCYLRYAEMCIALFTEKKVQIYKVIRKTGKDTVMTVLAQRCLSRAGPELTDQRIGDALNRITTRDLMKEINFLSEGSMSISTKTVTAMLKELGINYRAGTGRGGNTTCISSDPVNIMKVRDAIYKLLEEPR